MMRKNYKTKNGSAKNNKSAVKGFTLIEMLVSTFIFSITISAIVIIFSRQTASFSYVREQQRNIENAQYAVNFMAKTLRTSSFAMLANGGQTIYVYDFSHQSGQPCYRFDTRGGTVSVATTTAAGTSVDSCADDSRYSSPENDLTTGFVSGVFEARKTERNNSSTATNEMQVGLITVSLSVQDSDSASTKPTVLQTSVSLRDYPGEISF